MANCFQSLKGIATIVLWSLGGYARFGAFEDISVWPAGLLPEPDRVIQKDCLSMSRIQALFGSWNGLRDDAQATDIVVRGRCVQVTFM